MDLKLAWGRVGRVGEGVGEDGHYSGVLIQVAGINFIEGVGGGVVVVEVEATVLDGGEAGDTFFCEAGDVFACFRCVDECFCTDGVEDLGDRAEPLAERGLAGIVDAGWVVAAEIALNGANVIHRLACMLRHVGGGALGAFFFAHPGNESHRAAGMDA